MLEKGLIYLIYNKSRNVRIDTVLIVSKTLNKVEEKFTELSGTFEAVNKYYFITLEQHLLHEC